MIEAIKKALANYEDVLEFKDEQTRILVIVAKFTKKFDEIKEIVMNFDPKYYPYNRDSKSPAYWVIQKGRRAYDPPVTKSQVYKIQHKETKTPQPSKMIPSLPKDTMVHISYGEKLPNPSVEYGMIQSHITIDVPLERLADAQIYAVDFVVTELEKRMQDLRK